MVEDDPSLQRFYRYLLPLNEFELKGIAKNGDEAVSMFISFTKKPDVILMDYRMPIKNGIEASKEILNMDKATKIIFTTADYKIKEEALALGVHSFMDKPFTIDHLINEIKRISQPK